MPTEQHRFPTTDEGQQSSTSPDPIFARTAHAQLSGPLSPLTEMSQERHQVQFEDDPERHGRRETEEDPFRAPSSTGDVKPPSEALVQDDRDADALFREVAQRQARIEEEQRRMAETQRRLQEYYERRDTLPPSSSVAPNSQPPEFQRQTPPHFPGQARYPSAISQERTPMPASRVADPLRNLLSSVDPRSHQATFSESVRPTPFVQSHSGHAMLTPGANPT